MAKAVTESGSYWTGKPDDPRTVEEKKAQQEVYDAWNETNAVLNNNLDKERDKNPFSGLIPPLPNGNPLQDWGTTAIIVAGVVVFLILRK
jgi:hypothetical protein